MSSNTSWKSRLLEAREPLVWHQRKYSCSTQVKVWKMESLSSEGERQEGERKWERILDSLDMICVLNSCSNPPEISVLMSTLNSVSRSWYINSDLSQ